MTAYSRVFGAPRARLRSAARLQAFDLRRLLFAIPPLTFLALALPMSALTRAWNNNDEPSHIHYIEYLLAHHGFPAIGIQNGIESHQPPLYYLLGAVWQRITGDRPISITTLVPTADMHAFGWDVHWLRLVSIGCGLAVVIAAMVAARMIFPGRADVAVGVGLTVALWPKFLVVSTSVTNDVLADALGAWFVVGVLAIVQRGAPLRRRDWYLTAATGVAGGLAILSKFTAIPLVVLGLLVLLGRVFVVRSNWRNVALVAATAAVTCGWWFIRNQHLYGDPLATRATEQYLKIPYHGALVAHISALHAPSTFIRLRWPMLRRSLLYDGGWNQYALPHWLDTTFWWTLLVLGVVLLVGLVRQRQWLRPDIATLLVLAVAGPIAWTQIAEETSQGEGRYVFTSLVPIAILLLLPATWIRSSYGRVAALAAWPIAFLAVDGYVFATFILPNA